MKERRENKMITIEVKLWTDDLGENGNIAPKQAWDSGMTRIVANSLHGIESATPIPFQSLLELAAVIEKQLIKNGIKLHNSSRSKKYKAN